MRRAHQWERKRRFEGGATRSETTLRFDLIPPEALEALARRFGLGAAKHGEGNWKHGGPQFIKATVNHLLGHLARLLRDDPASAADNDLDAMAWNAAALCWFRANKPKEYRQALGELRQGLKQRIP